MGTITKSLNLLNFFSTERPEIGLTEFRKLSGQDKATVHRHLTELTESGFLEKNTASRAYRLGPAILRLAAVREMLFPTRAAVKPLVDRISETLGELVHVALFDGAAMSPLYHHDATIHGTRVHLKPSEILPMHATSSGLCQLAFGAPDLLDRVLSQPLEQWTDRTITDPGGLRQEVARTRASGIAHVDQGFETDVRSFAAPIFDIGELSIGSLAVAIPVSRHTDELEARIRDALKSGSIDVTEELGGVFPQSIKRVWQHD
ncbi:IclR family transcriptional regulator [Paracoccus tegillarcae]|uniref:IclR family transcriptional regulator n=1 Tax=Paracoccus tegillarcae TaxID=1529068 RepID=A0A2K9EWW4_9RHOB|nr:IclR family transcriptional regulator [Paracoccus tegillarcae]AUH35436.1 IclR family transcriptional regulator [Paracoccus tegillarcae]